MDYSKVLMKHYDGLGWSCNETYESIKWTDTATPKPTKGELDTLWMEIKKMR